MMYIMMDKAMPKNVFMLVSRVFPPIRDFSELLTQPVELHKTIEDVVVKLAEVLKYDHDAGICPDPVQCAKLDFSRGFGSSEIVTSLLSGNDEIGKVNPGGSDDARVSDGTSRGEERASQDGDN
jgi:hypothetical protein